MADLLPLALVLPLLTGLGLSFLLECLLQPGTLPFWRRPRAAFAVHLGLWLLLFALLLAVFRRPWFATANVLALQLLVVLVNNAKFQSLRETFIYQDFEYFTDTIKHPRLYLPFFGFKKAALAAIGYGLFLFSGLTFEPSLSRGESTGDFYLVLISLLLLGISFLWLGARKKLPVVFEPEKDLQQLGLVTSCWRYAEEEFGHCSVPSADEFMSPAGDVLAVLPNLVVVQSESFFDVRDLFAGIRPEILQHFDALKASATCLGKLQVPAWGANTVRTEFAFLSGLPAEKLGVHNFNPYRKLARQGIPTLASFLRKLGYRTVCVHPYPVSFYTRNKVMPKLGFDEFIDIRSFDGVAKTGPYIGDIALAEKVCALLQDSSTQPVFVFVISMENHGPLHLEKVQPGDEESLYLYPPPAGCDDLTIYLRHLANADRMAGMLRDCLQDLPGSNWLCWFGDHVPIMSKVYGAMGMPDGPTDYLIWQNGRNSGDGVLLDMAVANLAGLLLKEMGLADVLVKN